MKTQVIKVLITATLSSLLLAGGVMAQNVDYDFHWAPSPLVDDNGNTHTEAVAYEVYVTRGTDGKELLATVTDTTYTLSAEPGVVQRLVVRAVDANGLFSPFSEASDPIYFEAGQDNRGVPSVPLTAELGDAYPNPFNPETRVVYGVPQDATGDEPMQLSIYSVNGQLVRNLEVDPSPGWHEVKWDGKNNQGVVAPTGLYLTRFTVGTMVTTGKMTMVK